MDAIIWLGIVIVLIIIEIVTLGLTTIWFAGGALAACIAALLGAALRFSQRCFWRFRCCCFCSRGRLQYGI